jgi:hypothetical protein
MLAGVEHRQHRYVNNRAEHSHQPTRQRERRLQGVKAPGQAQRWLCRKFSCVVDWKCVGPAGGGVTQPRRRIVRLV